jgi:hypothetical protein
VLRAALERHLDALVPHMCRWPWLWPLLRYDEIAVVDTDPHGRFAAQVLYPCAGDKPDIYVWVEFSLGGTWTPVYRRPVACATLWNYACGKEITIRITDPRVPWCGDLPDMPGTEIGVLTLGNAINVRQIDGDGLAPGGKPLGGSLEPTVWFGAGLLAAGVTHYRWSYRRMLDATTPAEELAPLRCASSAATTACITPSGLLFKVYKVGPDDAVTGDTLFHIPPVPPPAGVWAPQVNARSNTASAYLVTGVPGARQVPDGRYELKLELFRVAGGVVTKATGLDFRVPPAALAAPFPPDVEIAFEAAPESYLLRAADGAVEAFVLRVFVDNSPCIAAIYPTSVPGSTQECGFITFPLAATHAGLGFLAAHPRGHGDFAFDVIRGSCAVGAAGATGKTGSFARRRLHARRRRHLPGQPPVRRPAGTARRPAVDLRRLLPARRVRRAPARVRPRDRRVEHAPRLPRRPRGRRLRPQPWRLRAAAATRRRRRPTNGAPPSSLRARAEVRPGGDAARQPRDLHALRRNAADSPGRRSAARSARRAAPPVWHAHWVLDRAPPRAHRGSRARGHDPVRRGSPLDHCPRTLDRSLMNCADYARRHVVFSQRAGYFHSPDASPCRR